jgi:lipopolysaccharide/colanic/teichoic acid biosynthesis glycosyltransferase/glycosyltransferase involved in cell wall biosynthesis
VSSLKYATSFDVPFGLGLVSPGEVLAPAPVPLGPLLRGASVALVHDFLLVMRGAERTFAAMADCLPQAPLYALLYDPDGTGERFAERGVRTSELQRLGFGQRGFRALLPLLPAAAGRLRIEGHDILLSSSSAFAHGVSVAPETVHVCYCHAPFRYVWQDVADALGEAPAPLRPVLRGLLAGIRSWDVAASRRVTRYIANSEMTRARIAQHWGREATVIHPPVDVDRFGLRPPEDYFVTVSELVRHKRVDLALEAAKRAHRPIKVIGTGPDLERLSAAYGDTAEFLGRIPDRDLEEVVGRARAFVLPGVEEFGIAAVEAQAAGRPVLAADAGGVRETVIAGETGVLVPRDDIDAFAEAMRTVDFDGFEPGRIRANAQRFSTASFQRALLAEVERVATDTIGARTPARDGRRAGQPVVNGRTAGQPAVNGRTAGQPAVNGRTVGEPAAQSRPDQAAAASSTRDPAQQAPAQVRQRHLVRRVSLLLADLTAALVSGLVVWALGGSPPRAGAAVAWPLLLIASIGLLDLYSGDAACIVDPGLDEAPGLFEATTISLMALTALAVLGFGGPADLPAEVALWILTPIIVLVARQVARRGASRITPVERCLVLVDDAVARRVEGILAASPRPGAKVVAHVAVAGARTAGTAVRDLAASHAGGAGAGHRNGRRYTTVTPADLPAMIRGLEVHRVIMSAQSHGDADSSETMQALRGLGVGISLLPAAFEMGLTRFTTERLGGLPVLGCPPPKRARGARALKRCLDVGIAAIALALLAPAFAVVAVLIKRDSAGPVLFRQRRVGRGGRQFSILKLRTMVDRADDQREGLRGLNESAGLFKLTRDPRVTRIGRRLRRASLDELPQLVNVLRGEMSLVGPRPLVPEEDALITGFGRRRLSVAPGISGPWQVLGPMRAPLEEMIQVDYLYVADWSLWGDAKILLHTASHILTGRGL